MNTVPNKTKPTILFLINKFKRGGAERMFIREINALVKLGYSVQVVTLLEESTDDSCVSELQIPVGSFSCIKMSSIIDIGAYRKILALISKHQVATVYSTLEYANIVARLVGLCRWSLRVCIRESNVATVKRLKFKILDWVLNARTNVIIAISKGVYDSLFAYQPFYRSKMVVVELAVEIPEKGLVCKPRHNEVFTILSVGRLTQQKRHDILIRALACLVKENHKDVRLVIIGGGSERLFLESLTHELGVTNHVVFAGVVSYEEVLDWYRQSDVFALASDWEGSCNVIREAMAHCLPVVSTNLPVINEAVIDGETGYLVEPANPDAMSEALKKLRADVLLGRTLGECGYQRVKERFNFEHHTNKLLTHIYEEDIKED